MLGVLPHLPGVVVSDPILAAMNADVLFDDICSSDPVRVAAALQAAHGKGDELAPKLVERFERVLVSIREPGKESVPFIGFLFFSPLNSGLTLLIP